MSRHVLRTERDPDTMHDVTKADEAVNPFATEPDP